MIEICHDLMTAYIPGVFIRIVRYSRLINLRGLSTLEYLIYFVFLATDRYT